MAPDQYPHQSVMVPLNKNFVTEVQYIARDPIYKSEKAYSADFVPEEGNTPMNHKFDRQARLIKHITSPGDFSLAVHGFCVVKARTAVLPDDLLRDQSRVEQTYINEVEALVHREFPEYKRVETMNCIVRQRDPRYPSTDDAIVTHEQPANIPHADFSHDGGRMQLDYAFPGQSHYFEDKEYDLLNIWRVLSGPSDDWPLALCDWNTVCDDDIIVNDDLHRTRLGENSLLHPNESHAWYYMGQQTPEDVYIFRNTDSSGKLARCFHCAIFHPHSVSAPRQSIEVRVVAIK